MYENVERNQMPKSTYHIIPFIWNLRSGKCICRTKVNVVVTSCGGRVVIDWEEMWGSLLGCWKYSVNIITYVFFFKAFRCTLKIDVLHLMYAISQKIVLFLILGFLPIKPVRTARQWWESCQGSASWSSQNGNGMKSEGTEKGPWPTSWQS